MIKNQKNLSLNATFEQLLNLFLVLSNDTPLKSTSFIEFAKFLNERGQLKQVAICQVRDINKLSNDWKLTKSERYELYVECAKILDKEGDSGAFSVYYQAIKLFDEDQNLRDQYMKNKKSSYQSEAEKLVINAIKSPEIVNFEEVIALEAIQDLKKTSKEIFDFVDLFTKKEIDVFKKDLASYKKLMDEHVVTMEMAIQKKQYVAICSLDLAEKSTYTFKEIATLLGIDIDDVEEWCIDAITNNIIDARIN